MITREKIEEALGRIRGCTFASLSAETTPSPGIKKITKDEVVILFNSRSFGYERMVKRRLSRLGKNPDNFVLGDLPWGERVGTLPLIVHKGRCYLQAIVIREGLSQCYIGGREVSCSIVSRPPSSNQGLPQDEAVVVRTYNLESLTSLKMLGEVLE